jgi:DNA-binding transcriptional LysR family regulator
MDRLKAMSAFVLVVDEGGFAPAAKRLGIASSGVTRLITALEDHLDVLLLQRTTRTVALTDAGARYLESARRILSALEEAEDAARATRTEPRGRLSVTAPNVFGRQEVAPLLSDFLQRYPAVSAELTLSDRMLNLIEEGVDVAVRIGALADSGLHARSVGSTRRVLVASPEYLAKRRSPLREPVDLAKHNVIQFSGLSEWRFSRGGEELNLQLSPCFTSNSADAVIGHALRGGGVALVLSYQVAGAVREGALRILLPSFEPPPSPIQIVYPSARLLSANVKAFIALATTTRDWNFGDL